MPLPDPLPCGFYISYVPDVDASMKPAYTNGASGLQEVRDVRMGIEVLSRHTDLFMWVFRDQLGLRAVCNKAFCDGALVKGVLGMVERYSRDNAMLCFS